MRRLLNRAQFWGYSFTGGSLFALAGCDPTVRDTVLGGVESASTNLVAALIQAFFESLAAEEEVPATVMNIAQQAAQFFA